MSFEIEVSDELKERMEIHKEDGETYEEFIEELLNIYESQGSGFYEGYEE
ncbi:MAG: hypothetical protein SV253_03345 [Halobacteria archaeon]|nr:hypothetical protein [Halobacteria archaeon]